MSEGEKRQGVKIGFWKEKSGDFFLEGNYAQGVKIGTWIKADSLGKKVEIIEFED